jgi:metal-responsive CopG/Arc/MetJ family transcriptional regulator
MYPPTFIDVITFRYESVDDDYMVKTTIDIPDEKWKKFSIKVIEEYGGRKKNDVIEELIDKYLREKEKDKK